MFVFLHTISTFMRRFILFKIGLSNFFLFQVLDQVELLFVLQCSRIQQLLVENGLAPLIITLLLGDGQTLSHYVLFKIPTDHFADGGISCYFYLELEVFVQLVLLFMVAYLVGRPERGQ
jgi:hypothetical protein